jgi:3-hydroxybutyryl-CoA dehydrogenase
LEIRKIGVLGAGQMGAGIAQVAASKQYQVVLRDIKQEFCDSAVGKIKSGLEKRVAQGKETQASVDATLGSISTTVCLETSGTAT